MADRLFDPSRLYEALKQQNLLPRFGNFTPPGKEGLFNSQTNTLVAESSNRDAMAHEMTHAVQFNLLKEAAQVIQNKKKAGQSLTDQEAQYLRAAEQIFKEQYGNVYQYDRSKDVQDTTALKGVQSLYADPKKDKDMQYYRTKPTEMQAFGVGRMSQPSVAGIAPNRDAAMTTGANPHLDPTMTTEFDILFSMFNSLPKDLQNSVGVSRQNNVKENRQFYNDTYLPYTSDIFSNPFPRSIK
jgi:hypothetical protein